MPLSRGLIIAYTVIPMTTSFFSIVGSSTIMTMIIISKKKFGDPYRRIIFGISFFDLLQSLAILLKIFKTTPEQPNAWIALGNQTSCNILGFLHFAGLNGALFYNVSLNVYLLCLIKYNMTAGYFRTRIEPFLHGIPALWAITAASIIVATGHMNPAFAGECLIAPYPVNCLMNPNVECIRGMHTDLYRTLFRVVPTFASMVAILVTLGMLWWTVRAQEKKMDRYRMNLVSLRLRASTLSGQISEEEAQNESHFRRYLTIVCGGFRHMKRKLSNRLSNRDSDDDDEQQQQEGQGGVPGRLSSSTISRRSSQRSSSNGNSNGRPFLIQARWYVIAFVLTHTCPIIVVCTEWGGSKPPPPVVMIAKIFTPLQGLFNIIIYTRPHVQKERSKNPRLSWWAAFKIVVKSGGDDDDERTNRLREGTGRRRTDSGMSRRRRRGSANRKSGRSSGIFGNNLRKSPDSNSGGRSRVPSFASMNAGHGNVNVARNSPSNVANPIPVEIFEGSNPRMSDDSNVGGGLRRQSQSQRSSRRVSILEVCDEEVRVIPSRSQDIRNDSDAKSTTSPPQVPDQTDTASGSELDLESGALHKEVIDSSCTGTPPPPQVFKLNDLLEGSPDSDDLPCPESKTCHETENKDVFNEDEHDSNKISHDKNCSDGDDGLCKLETLSESSSRHNQDDANVCLQPSSLPTRTDNSDGKHDAVKNVDDTKDDPVALPRASIGCDDIV